MASTLDKQHLFIYFLRHQVENTTNNPRKNKTMVKRIDAETNTIQKLNIELNELH